MLGRKDYKKAPLDPGIYFFRGEGDKILYVGKARNLRGRLLSYADLARQEPAKLRMLREAVRIEWTVLESEIEALIEEAIAIKQFKPPYNILFRDDKQYLYVAFTAGPFPYLFFTHQKLRSPNYKLKTINYKLNADYIGPFTDGSAVKLALKSLRRVFPFCTCKETHARPCLRSEIGRCLGVCCLTWVSDTQVEKFFPDAKERKKQYLKNIRAIKNILRGRKKSVIEELERDMTRLGKERKFEEAAAARDQLRALDNIFRHRRIIMRELDPERTKALLTAKELLGLPVIPHRIEGYDISNIQGAHAVGSMVVFENGQPKKSDYRRFAIRLKTPGGKADDFAMLQEVLFRRLRHPEWPLPNLFLIDGGKGQLSSAKAILEAAHIAIPVVSLAKREEELWLDSEKSIALKRVPPPLLFLFQHIRNEAHRFAISFHRKKRSRGFLPARV